ncbi:MAG: ribonuclease P protein component [Rhizobiaceae bacterium]
MWSRLKLMNGTLKPEKIIPHPDRLRKRSEYLSMRGARRFHSSGFTLQARRREANETTNSAFRFGYTVTRKTGNAVQRNRIRRRLKEVVRHIAGEHASSDHDYVIVARAGALTMPFGELTRELTRGLDSTGLHRKGGAGKPIGKRAQKISEAQKARAGKLT